MPVMTVNNENQHEQVGDYRARPRWSAGKKTEAVLRLLRGEPLETLSRELGVEAHRLAAWRDDFLERGKQGLKGQRPDRLLRRPSHRWQRRHHHRRATPQAEPRRRHVHPLLVAALHRGPLPPAVPGPRWRPVHHHPGPGRLPAALSGDAAPVPVTYPGRLTEALPEELKANHTK